MYKKTISTSITIFLKLIPIFYIIIFGVIVVFNAIKNFGSNVFYFLIISYILGIIYFYFVFLRIKEIKINDNYIYISNFFNEIQIEKTEIKKINYFHLHSPPIIWLSFKNKTKFGKRISFIPIIFRYYEIIEELNNFINNSS